MITAEEFLKDKFRIIYDRFPDTFKQRLSKERFVELHLSSRINDTEQNYPEMMIEFAKLHIIACKKDIAENYTYYIEGDEGSERLNYRKFTNEAYPLENIK